VLTSGFDGRVFRWDYASGQQIERITLRPARIPGQPNLRPVVFLSADGRLATWTRTPAATEVFDVESGSDLFTIPAPSVPPSTVTIDLSYDGTKVITACRRQDNRELASLVIWDLVSRQRFAEFEIAIPPGSNPPAPRLSPDGSRLVFLTQGRSPSAGREVLVVSGVDVKTGKRISETEDPAATGFVYPVAVDGTTAVLFSSTGRIWQVNYAEGRIGGLIDRIEAVPGVPTTFGPISFSGDGRRFAVGVPGEEPETHGVRVYEWPSTKLLHTFVGHRGPVSFIRFSPDGKFLASGSQDTSALLWELGKLPDPK
jgi:WD40 repeat protein